MVAKHRFTVVGRCPVDNCPEVYEVTVRADKTLMVEDIIAQARHQTAKPQTQEEFTAGLAARLGCRVKTTGMHSGVRTTVVCGPDQ